jgi:hypothetical protein
MTKPSTPTKAELHEMLAEAVRNTQPQPVNRSATRDPRRSAKRNPATRDPRRRARSKSREFAARTVTPHAKAAKVFLDGLCRCVAFA